MKKLTFYRCNLCGNFVYMVTDSGVIPTCCGEDMERIVSNTVDASAEKHVPVIRQVENKITVCVGDKPHPMTKEHYIEWIILQTDRGTYTRRMLPDDKPESCFYLCSDEHPVCAYIWCNLHGLWAQNADG